MPPNQIREIKAARRITETQIIVVLHFFIWEKNVAPALSLSSNIGTPKLKIYLVNRVDNKVIVHQLISSHLNKSYNNYIKNINTRQKTLSLLKDRSYSDFFKAATATLPRHEGNNFTTIEIRRKAGESRILEFSKLAGIFFVRLL